MPSASHVPFEPALNRTEMSGVIVHTDEALRTRTGIVVAFSERTGGVSTDHYESLDLAGHVGDDPAAVNRNRDKFARALGIEHLRERCVTAEQVHGSRIEFVESRHAGCGARVDDGAPPIPATDALVTTQVDVPLLMLYADCVPIVIVAPGPSRAIAVVHAGWRGALASLPGTAALRVASHCGCDPGHLLAYVGPHIGVCCYEVAETILSQFRNNFDTIGAVYGRLDLAAVVRESLTRSGVVSSHIAEVGLCTRDNTDRFFSYRATPTTGRHGALAVITEGE